MRLGRAIYKLVNSKQRPEEALIASGHVIPAKAGIQEIQYSGHRLSPV
jgi:hypothetical protein